MWPSAFEERLARIYDEATAGAVLASMRSAKAFALWDNPLRSGGIHELLEDLEVQAASPHHAGDGEFEHFMPQWREPVVVLPGVYRLEDALRDRVMRHPLVTDGALYPINPSSVIAALSLCVEPGDEVLDLAAAPGGKSLLLAAALTPDGVATGRLALVEPVKARFHRLRANLKRCGVHQADYYQRDGRGVGVAVGERFHRVLLDAPCSSESRFHVSRPESAAQWSARKVKESARKQRRLILSAYRALRPGGTLVYSTCAFGPEENECVVAHLLRTEPAAVLDPLSVGVPPELSRPGLARWEATDTHAESTLRIVPDDLWNGFFVARVRKPA